MAGPWDKYSQKTTTDSEGPWSKYKVEPEQETVLQQAGKAGSAALDSFSNAATLGYLPHIQAIAEKLMPNPNSGIDAKLEAQGFKIQNAPEKTYTQLRDENIAKLEQQKKENPIASGVGTVAGMLGTAVGTGGLGAVAKGASGLQRFKAAVKAGGILGGLANPGDTEGEFSPLQIEERGKNAALGAAFGAGGQLIAEGAGVVASKASEALGKKAAAKAARAVGRPTPTQAAEMARTGDDIAMGRALLDKKAIPVLGTPARIAKNVDKLKEGTWNEVEKILARHGDEAVVDGAEAGMKILNSKELSLLRDAGETQAVKALEDAAEQLASMKDLSLSKAQQIKKTIDGQINYNKAIPDMTGGQAARFAKRTALRDQMDQAVTNLGGGKGELKSAFKNHGLLEKASDIAEREAGRTQANRAISLTDTIAGAAGMANGPTTAMALAAANKFGRTFGNSIQARSYDAVAKQLAKIPQYSTIAENNPGAFAALVQRVASGLESNPAPLRQQFVDDKEPNRDVAQLKGEALWMQRGAEKLGIDPNSVNSKEARSLIIEASDLPKGSKRLEQIKQKLSKGMEK